MTAHLCRLTMLLAPPPLPRSALCAPPPHCRRAAANHRLLWHSTVAIKSDPVGSIWGASRSVRTAGARGHHGTRKQKTMMSTSSDVTQFILTGRGSTFRPAPGLPRFSTTTFRDFPTSRISFPRNELHSCESAPWRPSRRERRQVVQSIVRRASRSWGKGASHKFNEINRKWFKG